MTKYIHCVFVNHGDSDKNYLFCVDDMDRLTSGTKVICNTIQGQVKGVCIGSSFCVSERALESICSGVGAYLPLHKVVGIITSKTITEEEIHFFDDKNSLPY